MTCFKFEMLNWDDIRLFIAVARAGGLAGAVSTTKLSPPTLGRRIRTLEHSLGVILFDRHRSGYDLTIAGRELLERSAALEHGAAAIERWQIVLDPRPVIRIAKVPSLAWLERSMPHPPQITCSSSPVVLAAVLGGAGLCVLPRFIGDSDRRLVPVSDSIEALASTRWLVSHDDDRHMQPLRLVADRLAHLFSD